ncbi:ABC transporter substrate-binding protein [Streptomyces sp. AM 3-1-1]|uniref:ABC transporter substrate-binding protein n=1 Tax=Streptomyces sp. AM 3-1-1 TaxID=3028711 RepID=UPI0023B9AF79|nr:ABC transporter substrate-binding protein [Streptomyces sp. AM 3-1-1]WEH26562.1 ABC transporter substrate-binding protein [Streptomyces sp. AM 3-1-1]
MNRKTWVLPVAIGVLAPVLAGCGDSGSGDGGGKPIVVGTTDAYEKSADAPAPLDPAYAYDSALWNVLRQTVQSLVRVPKGGGQPQPDAAKSCKWVGSGGTVYTCEMRDGLQFPDGTGITSKDVKYSIQRVLDIKDPNGAVGLLSGIKTMDTPDEKHITFHLSSPDATLPYKLATPVAGIVQKKFYPPKSLRKGYVLDGSGPYTLKAETNSKAMTKVQFTKNPKYKGSLTVKNNRVDLVSYAGAPALGDALEAGKIDVMTGKFDPSQVETLLDNPPEHIQFMEMPGLETHYIIFDTSNPATTKPVRQAVAQLVDRGEIASKVYSPVAEPLYSLVPAAISGHTNSFFNRYGNPNVAKAKTILEKAGITTPVKFDMYYSKEHYGPAKEKEYKLIQKQLNDSGLFDVSLKDVADWTKYRKDGMDGKYPAYTMAWAPDFPDADNYIAPFLDADNFLNSPYNSKEIRKTLIPAERRGSDRGEATPDLEKIQDIVADDVPVVPMWQGKQYIGARDDITGVEWSLSTSTDLQLWELARGVGD